ncbi:hypothetical protein GS485_17535 [Rhodococcus hoagii]|nr:hypothetical protein [Prescottella equi]
MEDGSFKVIANTDEAKASLADMIGRLNMLTNTKAQPGVALDKTEFDTNAAQARDLLKILDQSKAAPEIAPILDKLKEGKQITLADLQEIGAKVAEPEVIAKVADALRDINAVDVAAIMLLVHGLSPSTLLRQMPELRPFGRQDSTAQLHRY